MIEGMVIEAVPATPVVTNRRFRLSALWLPATYSYVGLLILGAVALTMVSAKNETRIVLHASTNLHNLANGRFGTLFSSAFLVGEGAATAFIIVPFLACLLALAERRFGAVRLVHTFFIGHIGATVLVAVGLWVAVESQLVPNSITMVEDVGVSYGAMAVVGALIAVLPSHRRFVWAASWLTLALGGVLVWHTFTNVGHFLALCLGLGIGRLMIRRQVAPQRPMNWTDYVLLAGGSVFACLMLLG
ncbi:rhomboid-like protein [Nocardia sp. CDC160]|uniref:rhomboid-like protein n=1 Tax=Nocardia sp. CDC160 TaxID=3112166 RepID=UPI002DB7A052|nr:rhomboid-like protein [Nocardia sp. CDC160]MEC3920663.1 rhomboid-like protein [Nocardia sp. CDC160]